MSFKFAALIGAIFGAIGPISWGIAYRAGRRTYGPNNVFRKLYPITPCIVLALGFTRGNRAYPRDREMALTILIANMTLFAGLAVAVLFIWRLI